MTSAAERFRVFFEEKKDFTNLYRIIYSRELYELKYRSRK